MTWIVHHNAPRPVIPRSGTAQALALRQQVRPIYDALRARGYDPGAAAPRALGQVLAQHQKGDER